MVCLILLLFTHTTWKKWPILRPTSNQYKQDGIFSRHLLRGETLLEEFEHVLFL